MKLRIILLLACLVSFAVPASADLDSALSIQAGYFASAEDDERAGQFHADVDGAPAYGIEYISLMRDDTAVTVAAFISNPDLEGRVWTAATTSQWVPFSIGTSFLQLSVSYIKFEESTNGDIDDYEGFFYGAGAGWSRWDMDDLVVNGTLYTVDDFDEGSFDMNLILGYQANNGFGVDFKWIVDEKAILLTGHGWLDL